MNRHDWLTSNDPLAMLRWLGVGMDVGDLVGYKISRRQLRLVACACSRAHAQRRFQGQAWCARLIEAAEIAEAAADGLRDLPPWRCTINPKPPDETAFCVHDPNASNAALMCITQDWQEDWQQANAGEASIVREIVGDLFWPSPAWSLNPSKYSHALAWKVALAIYQDRDWAGLPVLADAIEEAGHPTQEQCWRCDGTGIDGLRMIYDARKYIIGDPDYAIETKPAICDDCKGTGWVPSRLLVHLRDKDARHVLGCWALDLTLGKE